MSSGQGAVAVSAASPAPSKLGIVLKSVTGLSLGVLIASLGSCETTSRDDLSTTDPARAALIAKMKDLSATFGVECENCHVDRITYDRNGTGDIAQLMMTHSDFAGPDWLSRERPREDAYECHDCHRPAGHFDGLTEEGQLTSVMVDIPSMVDEMISSRPPR